MKSFPASLVLVCSAFFSACGNSENSGATASVSQDVLTEQDPLVFAQSYVKHVQDDADEDLYAKFMHPSVRTKLKEGSKMAAMLYQNALLENPAIESSDALEGGPRVKDFGGGKTIRFQLDKKIPFQDIYPDSPFADEGLTIQSGQINLQRFEDRWGIVGHSLDGE